MIQLVTLLFLGIMSYQDIKNRELSWAWLILFAVAAVCFKLKTAPFEIVIMYGICYAVAVLFDKCGMEFGGGDVKVLSVLAGMSGLLNATLAGIVGLAMWKVLRYPHKVPFVPYLMVAWMAVEIVSKIKLPS